MANVRHSVGLMRTRISPTFRRETIGWWRGRTPRPPSTPGTTTISASPANEYPSGVMISQWSVAMGYAAAVLRRSASATTSSMPPHRKKACSGTSSCLPSRISWKPRIVSSMRT